MYQDKEWRNALTYPDIQRRSVSGTRSDYFHGKIYKQLRATAGPCDHFISFAHCADAVAANKRMSRSILPINLRYEENIVLILLNPSSLLSLLTCPPPSTSILNYDPRVRHKKENFLLTFLMPPKLSTTSARKFIELLEDELNRLYYTGIADGALKGALVMLRNDQKGKEFDLGLRSCTSYDAPCSVCEIMADPGFGPFTKVSVGGYRKFLPANHPYRRDPRFGHPELGPAPCRRNKARSREGVQIALDPESPLPYYQVPGLFANIYSSLTP